VFACGQSPLCVEVNRLVRSGVVVAGDTGYGTMEGPKASGMSLTINDPGNADLAITVGSTHREMPHSVLHWLLLCHCKRILCSTYLKSNLFTY